MKVSVIVTNWNGKNLLQKNLPQVIKTSPEASEIVVADDASSDNSLNYLKRLQKKYPIIKIIANKSNLGFAKNSNQAVKAAKSPLVVLLNSDIFPQKNYIKNSLPLFTDPKVFGVGFAEIGNENWGKIFWRSGYLQYTPGPATSKPHITAWLSGGSSIVRRQAFLRLGGFDSVYQPFYCEDLDLGFRAWKSGYQLLWQPKSKVKHQHEATTSKFNKTFLEYVKERNRLLTVWRNISDPQLLQKNRIATIGRVLSGPNYIKIIRAAKRQIKNFPPPIVFPQLNDRQIFNLFQ